MGMENWKLIYRANNGKLLKELEKPLKCTFLKNTGWHGKRLTVKCLVQNVVMCMLDII